MLWPLMTCLSVWLSVCSSGWLASEQAGRQGSRQQAEEIGRSVGRALLSQPLSIRNGTARHGTAPWGKGAEDMHNDGSGGFDPLAD